MKLLTCLTIVAMMFFASFQARAQYVPVAPHVDEAPVAPHGLSSDSAINHDSVPPLHPSTGPLPLVPADSTWVDPQDDTKPCDPTVAKNCKLLVK